MTQFGFKLSGGCTLLNLTIRGFRRQEIDGAQIGAWAGNYTIRSVGFGADFKARRMGTSCIVVSHPLTHPQGCIFFGIALDLVAAGFPGANHLPRGLAAEQLFTDPEAGMIVLFVTAGAAERLARIFDRNRELGGTSRIAAAGADLLRWGGSWIK
jgi:hypothetical protein